MKKIFSLFLILSMLSVVVPSRNAFAMITDVEKEGPDSSLVDHYIPTANRNDDGRINTIYITIHCMAGEMSAIGCAKMFQNPDAWASANYMIGASGDVAQGVPEKDRAWTSGGSIKEEGLITGSQNDQHAITIECASDTNGDFVNKAVFDKAVDLTTDILKRHGKETLSWVPDKREALTREDGDKEMRMTAHCFYAAKACPGSYLLSRFGDIAEEVTARLHGATPISLIPDVAAPSDAFKIMVRNVTEKEERRGILEIHESASAETNVLGTVCREEMHDILKKEFGPGSDKGWGKLKGRDGWISLDCATFIKETIPENAANFKVRIRDERLKAIGGGRIGPERNEIKVYEDADTSAKVLGRIEKSGVYKIVATKIGNGSNVGWGKLENGLWIPLDNAVVVRDSVPVDTVTIVPLPASEVAESPSSEAASSKSSSGCPFFVKVTVPDLKIYKGPGESFGTTGGVTGAFTFTIVDREGDFGKLKSGAGWVNLKDPGVQVLDKAVG